MTTPANLHVAVLMGGWSAEREVSLSTGRACCKALEEVGFAESLCDQPPGTVLALSRVVEGGAVRERFRTLHRRSAPHSEFHALPVFTLVEVSGEEAVERPDLTALALPAPASAAPDPTTLTRHDG